MQLVASNGKVEVAFCCLQSPERGALFLVEYWFRCLALSKLVNQGDVPSQGLAVAYNALKLISEGALRNVLMQEYKPMFLPREYKIGPDLLVPSTRPPSFKRSAGAGLCRQVANGSCRTPHSEPFPSGAYRHNCSVKSLLTFSSHMYVSFPSDHF